MAPAGYAAIAVMRRVALWQGDDSSRYDDAWTAFSAMKPDDFAQKFERGEPGQVPTVLLVQKAELGGEHAIYVEYELAATNVTVRIHSYLILHNHEWYAVTMATRASEPSLHREEMEAAAKTFRLRDG